MAQDYSWSNALKAQTEAIVHLTAAVECLLLQPSCSLGPMRRSQQSIQTLYRMQHPGSRAKENEDGDIVAGNPNWTMNSEDDVALHFAEFHSDNTSKKDTILISATHDPIRAIKAAYQIWNTGSFNTRDANQVHIYVIQSTDTYSAKDLKEMVLGGTLCTHLSRESRSRLMESSNARLYDSERLFLSRIPKEQIRARVSLQDLFNANLLDDMLPELREKLEGTSKPLGPSAIRNRIHYKCDGAADKVARRFKAIYYALAGIGIDGPKRPALKLVQELIQGDPTLDECVREAGYDVIQHEIDRSKLRMRVKVERP